MIFGDDLSEAQ